MSSLSSRPRKSGYALMVLALLAALCARVGLFDDWRAGAAMALVLILAAAGVMLVFTDLLVRALYAQLDAAKDPPETAPPETDDVPN
jgi:ABC-type glycerol-3-phosphate transport system permease component